MSRYVTATDAAVRVDAPRNPNDLLTACLLGDVIMGRGGSPRKAARYAGVVHPYACPPTSAGLVSEAVASLARARDA